MYQLQAGPQMPEGVRPGSRTARAEARVLSRRESGLAACAMELAQRGGGSSGGVARATSASCGCPMDCRAEIS
jgi:hypothetical protein